MAKRRHPKPPLALADPLAEARRDAAIYRKLLWEANRKIRQLEKKTAKAISSAGDAQATIASLLEQLTDFRQGCTCHNNASDGAGAAQPPHQRTEARTASEAARFSAP
jgi:hypothetical protein